MKDLVEILNSRAKKLPVGTPMKSFTEGGDPWLHLFAERWSQAPNPDTTSPFYILILQDWGSVDDETGKNKSKIPTAADAAEQMKLEWKKKPEDIKEKTTRGLVKYWRSQYENHSLLVFNAVPGLRPSGCPKNGELPAGIHRKCREEFWGPLLNDLISRTSLSDREIHLIFSGSWAFDHSEKIDYGKPLCPDSVAKVYGKEMAGIGRKFTIWWTCHPSYRGYKSHLKEILGRSST